MTLLPMQLECLEANVFTRVCHSVHRGRACMRVKGGVYGEMGVCVRILLECFLFLPRSIFIHLKSFGKCKMELFRKLQVLENELKISSRFNKQVRSYSVLSSLRLFRRQTLHKESERESHEFVTNIE